MPGTIPETTPETNPEASRVIPEVTSTVPGAGATRILVIIPAYNEAEALPGLLRLLAQEAPFADLLVINDGSTDTTGQVADSFPGVAVVNLPCNLGIGGSVQTGFKYAQRKGYDIAIQVDGDGQHKPAELANLMAPVIAGGIDMVIGSRFLEKSSFRSSPLRRVGIGIFAFLNSVLIGQSITDNTSGFRAYSRRAIAFLADHYPADYPEPETVILLARNGFKIRELAVEMLERQGGATSITALRSAYYMTKVVLAVLMTACRPPLAQRKP